MVNYIFALISNTHTTHIGQLILDEGSQWQCVLHGLPRRAEGQPEGEPLSNEGITRIARKCIVSPNNEWISGWLQHLAP